MGFYTEILPLSTTSPAAPFTGFFLNLCVATDAHIDPNDLGCCAVIVFGPFKKGQLVLYELGLVFDLTPGQALLFPSRRFTHFNLDFEGLRASVVLAFDKTAVQWEMTQNGWKKHLNTNRQ